MNANVERVVRPKANGTKKLYAKHGRNLVAVRYRYDRKKMIAYTTAELIADQRPIKR